MTPLRNCALAFLLSFVFVPRNAAQDNWIGTWAAAPQALPGGAEVFHNQTLRLIVHTSAGGKKVRIKISNTFGTSLCSSARRGLPTVLPRRTSILPLTAL